MIESIILYVACPIFLSWIFVSMHIVRKQNSYLVSIATRDELTGLWNKRGGDDLLKHHYAILQRNFCRKNGFALLYIDVDRFKGINDKYGHHMGDMALKFVAELLAKIVRGDGYDTVIRWSGDEFGIILPHSDFQKAEIVKKKIKDALLVTFFEAEGVRLSLRVSIGIATSLEEHEEGPGSIRSLEYILRLADGNMYEQKPKKRKKYVKKGTRTS